MRPPSTSQSDRQHHGMRSFVVIVGALIGAAVIVLLLAVRPVSEASSDDEVPLEAASSTDNDGVDRVDPDLDGAFDPVEVALPPQPTAPPIPAPIPTPTAAPSPPAPPAPPMLGASNECPGYRITTPAVIVWGLEDPDGRLNGRADASPDAPVVRTFPGDALTQVITGGCRPGPDGTPWLEHQDSAGSLSYSSSEYLRVSTLVCLRGRVEGRAHPDVGPDTWFEGPLDGHGYTDGGSFAAFIRNEDIGVTNTYRLVPRGSLTFSGGCRS